jgi:hypothetical protein
MIDIDHAAVGDKQIIAATANTKRGKTLALLEHRLKPTPSSLAG